MTIIKAVIGSGCASILLLVFEFGIWSVLVSNVIAVLVGLIYGRWTFRKKSSDTVKVFKLNYILLKDFFNYSYKLYLGGIISYFNVYLMKSLLSVYLVPARVAFYSMAQDRATLLDKIPTAVNTLLYPRISNSNKTNAFQSTATAFRIILILSTFSAIFLAILIKPLVLLMYGKEFLPMVLPLLLILPGILIKGATSVFTSYFNGTGRSDLIMKLSIFPLFFQLLLGYILIRYYDIAGAAISFTLSMAVFGLIQTVFFIKLADVSLKLLLPKSEDYLYIIIFFKTKFLKNDKNNSNSN